MKYAGIFLLAASALAQSCPDKQELMPLLVELRNRTAKEELAPSDFFLSGKGVKPEVVSLDLNAPADIIVLIEDRQRGGQLAGAADYFVNMLRPDDRVIVMTYGTSTKKQTDWIVSATEISKAIEKGADGWHLQIARPLFAVGDALKLFPKPTATRKRAIFMLGDDQDHFGESQSEQVAASLIERRVTLQLAVDPAPPRKIPRINVTTPALGNQTPAQLSTPATTQSVRNVAVTSGGMADVFTDVSFFRAMRERLDNSVLLGYCVEHKHAGKAPTVELSTSGQQKWPEVELVYPGKVSLRK